MFLKMFHKMVISIRTFQPNNAKTQDTLGVRIFAGVFCAIRILILQGTSKLLRKEYFF